MQTRVTIQIGHPSEVCAQHLPPGLWERTAPRLDEAGLLVFEDEDPLAREILEANARVDGVRLLRLVRYSFTVELADLDFLAGCELRVAPERDRGLPLSEPPARYYRVEVTCEACCRVDWRQRRDLEVGRGPRDDFDQTRNGEIVVSAHAREMLESASFGGVELRPVLPSSLGAWQLLSPAVTRLRAESPIVEYDPCAACGLPRTRALRRDNGVDLFDPGRTETCVEVSPIVHTEGLAADLSLGDLPVGTLAHRPQGAPPLDAADFQYRPHWQVWLASAGLARAWLESGLTGVELRPINWRPESEVLP